MDVDIELCGTDQTFNAMAGRVLQKRINNKEKFVIVLKLGENPKTGKLMSKSEGTGVFLSSSPEDMFGAIMSQPDEMTEVFFVNNTRIPLEQKENIFSLGPKEAKEKIALEVVKNIHGEKQAQKAQFNFSSVFGGGGIPQDAPTYKMKEGETVIESLFNAGIGTKSEIKRLITLWSVKNLNTEEVVKNWTDITKEGTYKIGKHRFLKII
jgi:tyrosyl-tRNA synthetase